MSPLNIYLDSFAGVFMAAVTIGRRNQRTHRLILRVLSNIVVGKFKREPLLGGSLLVSALPLNILNHENDESYSRWWGPLMLCRQGWFGRWGELCFSLSRTSDCLGLIHCHAGFDDNNLYMLKVIISRWQ